jgi:hypothetical protein
MIMYWSCEKRFSRHPPIQSKTINSYISHVVDALITNEIVQSSSDVRCIRLKWMLEGWKKFDDLITPLRLKISIPLTYAIFLVAHALVPSIFKDKSSILAVRAALALGYGCSFRPNEYLKVRNSFRDLKYVASTNKCDFWYGDKPVPCTSVTRNMGYPTDISWFVDFLKNDTEGNGGPRSIASVLDAPVNLTHVIADYIFEYPPLPNVPFLASHGTHVTTAMIEKVLHTTALKCKLDPTRLLCHAIRAGALSQLEDASDETKRRQGFWGNGGGHKPYCRKSLSHSRSVSRYLHDPTQMTIEQSRAMYMDHN